MFTKLLVNTPRSLNLLNYNVEPESEGYRESLSCENATGADNQQERPSIAECRFVDCGFESTIRNLKSKIERILRDYTPDTTGPGRDDIVRSSWRHGERGRNDRAIDRCDRE